MWFDSAPADRWTPAIDHLRRDKTLAKIIARVGPCTLRPKRNYYVKLVQSILSQQVSVKAAEAMYRKLDAAVGGVSPESVGRFLRTADDASIKSCGVSRQKRNYLIDLSEKWIDGSVPHRRFSTMNDAELIESLTSIKGIGRWTAEMLLIFALNRPDVWPVDDLGIRESVCRHWPRRFKERPTAKDLLDFADAWRPWRSVASWYLWRGKDG